MNVLCFLHVNSAFDFVSLNMEINVKKCPCLIIFRFDIPLFSHAVFCGFCSPYSFFSSKTDSSTLSNLCKILTFYGYGWNPVLLGTLFQQ